jgi:hypothetical protein
MLRFRKLLFGKNVITIPQLSYLEYIKKRFIELPKLHVPLNTEITKYYHNDLSMFLSVCQLVTYQILYWLVFIWRNYGNI